MAESEILIERLSAEMAQSHHDGQVVVVEEILSSLHGIQEPEDLATLFSFLDDHDTRVQVQWAIAQTLEGFPVEIYCKGLLEALTLLEPRAPDWAETLMARSVNSMAHMIALMKLLATSNAVQRQTLAQILGRLTRDDEEWQQKASPLAMLLKALDGKP